MIKIITTFQSALVAMLMGILGLATDYWKVWWKVETATNIKKMYNAGLFFQCDQGDAVPKNTTIFQINHLCVDLVKSGKGDRI